MSVDRVQVTQLLELCKSNSPHKVLKALLVIRNEIIRSGWGIQLLRECGGAEVLVSLLKRPKEDVLELALSTLGNCCMDEQTSLAVGRLKITPQVVSIVKTLGKDKLVGRACRLLGNLAQQRVNAAQLLEEGAVPALVAILSSGDSDVSAQTLSMAVRAIRLLWVHGDKQEDVLSCGAVRAVAVLLCKECERARLTGPPTDTSTRRVKVDKDREALLKGLLKCLGHCTATTQNNSSAEQILGEGTGYRCLVVLCKYYEELASKCLVNLCYVGPCRPVLGAAGAVECLVDLINKNAGYPEYYLNAVCLLCREAVNRAKLRQCGGLTILLGALRDTEQPTRHATALKALLQFVFDDISFQMLIEEGLILVIEDQLEEYVATMRCEHQRSDKDREECGATAVETSEGCRIEIERDNMIIGFNDEFTISDSESRASHTEGETSTPSHKRGRDREGGASDKDTSLQKMAKYDWSFSSISCEPKLDAGTPLASVSPSSGYSPAGSSSRSPDSRNMRSGHVYTRMPSRGDDDILSNNEGCSNYSGGHWSPGSPSSLCYSSPYDDECSDSERSERYSPVCSDVDEEPEGDREGEGHTNEAEDLLLDDETLSIKELQLEESSAHQSKSHGVRCLLVLLSRASHCDSAIEHLASQRLLMALLGYVRNARNPANRAARVLARIISHATHIIKILKFRVVLHLYKVVEEPRHGDCRQCSQLKTLCTKLMTQVTMLAESDYGIGEISYQLQKGEPRIRQSLALTLPYVIRAHRPLKRYLVGCKAFELLLSVVSQDKEPLHHCVPSLSQLARTLHVKDPRLLENTFKSECRASYHPPPLGADSTSAITLVLDDGSGVLADKALLCQQSDVFSAMLQGAFKESNESSVRLKSVSRCGLEYLLVLLQCGANNRDRDLDTFPLPDRLSTSLETLLLADKFLMETLKSSLYSALIQFKLRHTTACEVYVWSLEEGMGLLCVETVAHVLTGDMTAPHRLHTVATIMGTRYRQQFLEDVRGIIGRHLA